MDAFAQKIVDLDRALQEAVAALIKDRGWKVGDIMTDHLDRTCRVEYIDLRNAYFDIVASCMILRKDGEPTGRGSQITLEKLERYYPEDEEPPS